MLKITYPAKTSGKARVATSAYQFGRQTKAPAGENTNGARGEFWNCCNLPTQPA
jgi:hypothetical protein